MEMNQTCKYCKAPTNDSFYFCPNCGKKLKEPPYKFSWGKTIVIILESIFLPPLGIIPGIRHLLKNDTKAQAIGLLALGLTFISTGIAIIYSINLINSLQQNYSQILQMQQIINSADQNQNNLLNQINSFEE